MTRFILFVFYCINSFGLSEGPQGFTLDGRLYNSSVGSNPLLDNSVNLRLQILDTNKNCILYEETQNVSTSASNGYFNISVGSATTDSKRTSIDSGNYMAGVFQNLSTINGRSVTSGGACSYLPVAGDQRFLRVVVLPSSTNVQVTLAPDMKLNSVPSAVVAESLNGISTGNILQADSTTQLNQSSLSSVFSNTNYPKLTSLLAGGGNYVSSTTSSGASLPSFSTSTPPASPLAGSVWFDSTSGTVKYFNGSTTQVLSSATGALSGDVTGTLSATTVATVGGSSASNVHAAELLANSATSNNTNNMIVRRDSSGGFSAGSVSTSSIVARDGASNSVTLQAPSTVSASYTLTWPTAAPVSNGQVLTGTTAGVLSWTTPYSDANARAAISATAPLSYSSGVLSLNGAASGDLSANYPSPKVSGLQGTPVSSATPTAGGQVLRYNGSSQYAPAFLGVADLRSSLAGSAQLFPTNCTSSQTLTYSAVSDTFSCATISVGASNFGSQAQNAVLAGPSSGGAGAPTFRPLASSDLPVGAYDTTYFKNGGNSFGAAASLGTADNFPLSLKANNNVAMTVLPTGSVGIGTTNPLAPLEVVGPIRTSGGSSEIQLMPRDTGAMRSLYNNQYGLHIYDNTGGERLIVSPTGNVGIGTTTPSAVLQLKAGTTAVSSAPLKLTSGPLMSTAEDGAIEYDGTNYYLTVGTARTPIPLSGGATSYSTVGAGMGSSSAPSLTFSGDTNTGFFDSGSNDVIGVAAGGTNIFNLSSAGMVSPVTGGASVTSAAGTAAAPTYSFAGDAGTGWFRPLASTLAASTGGVERMRVDASGNVGIGTTTPISKTEIQDSTASYSSSLGGFRVSNPGGGGANYGLRMGYDMSIDAGYIQADKYLVSTRPLVLNAFGGNVGIGTTNPSSKLTLNTSAAFDGFALTNGATNYGMLTDEGSATGRFSLGANGTTNVQISASQGTPTFFKGGNFGIGTTTPQGAFDVRAGTAAASTDGGNLYLYSQNAGAGGSNNGGNIILMPGNSTNGSNASVGIGTTNPGARLHIAAGSSGKGANYNTGLFVETSGTSNSYYTFQTASSGGGYSMTVTNAGNVGIGTTTPGAPLDVKGAIRMSGSTSGYTGFQPAAAAGGTVWTLPANDGTANQTLTTNGSGILTWSTPAGTGLSSLNGLTSTSQSFATGTTGTAPAFVSATSTHTLNIPLASTTSVTAGLLSNSDYTNFTNKLTSILADGKIFVGNGSSVATAVTPSGDVTMADTGAFTVAKLQGSPVSATAPTTAGQALRWSGSAWAPGFIAMTDLRSTVTGTNQFANSCLSNQTLTYNSVGDVMSCTNISLPSSQITGSVTPANGGTGQTTYAVGDVLYASSTTALSRLPAGTNGQVLSVSSGLPAWTASVSGLPAAAGTAAAPGYAFVGNTNTGMFSPITNSVGFSTNGVEAMRILASGKVGIGTTTPLYSLDVSGSARLSGLYVSGPTASLNNGSNSSSLNFFAGDSFDPTVSIGANAEYVKADGFYRLGTGPSTIMALNQGNFRVLVDGSGSSGTGTGTARFSVTSSGAAVGSGNGYGYNTIAPADGLIVQGNVGIGTTSPGAALDVKGAIRMSGSTSGYTGFQPAAAAGSTVWTLPANDGTANQTLTTNGSGILTWSTPSGTGISSLNGLNSTSQNFATGTTGTAPAFVSATSTHTLNIPLASSASVTAGLLSNTDYTSFTNKLTSTLADGKIFVGNSGGTATAVTPSGDVTMADTGALTVAKMQGSAVSATAPTTAGQALRWSGSSWSPGFIAMTDLRSTVTGTNQFANSCLSNQTLTYNSVGDVMACTNISLPSSQLTGSITPANGGTGQTIYAVGDVLYASSTTALSRLPAGTNGQVLTVASGLPSWASSGGGLPASAGTAAAPGYAFSGNTNTGMFSPATNTIGLSTNGAEVVRVTASGQVGIGTTAPAQALDIVGNARVSGSVIIPTGGTFSTLYGNGDTMLQSSILNYATSLNIYPSGTANYSSIALFNNSGGGTNQAQIIETTNGLQVGTYNSLPLTLQTNNTARMTVDASGNVGIGTTSPGARLQVGTQGVVISSDPSLSASNLGAVSFESGNQILSFGLGTGSTNYAQWIQSHNAYGSSFPLVLNAAGGNVGIGTATPGAALDVNGAIRMSGSTSGYTGFQPAAVAGSTIWTLPANDGSANQVLTTNGSGVLAWSTPAGTGISSLNGLTTTSQTFATGTTGTAPSFTSATSTHTLNIPLASTALVTAGLLSNSDYTTFTNKLTSTLADGKIFVGNSGGTAAAVTPSGDATMTDAGAFTVGKLQGTTVSATAPTTAGQALRWSGSAWAPGFIAMTDLRSKVTGTNQFASSCLNNQTLTYNSVGDVMSCANISLPTSQITGSVATANGGTGQSNYAVGDLLYASSTSALSRLPAGANGQVLTLASGIPSWSAASGGGGLPAAPGTAAAPGYAFLGNTNTGMFGADTNTIGLATNGAEAMRILPSGSVGIGTTAPLGGLHVVGPGGATAIIQSSTAATDLKIGGQTDQTAVVEVYRTTNTLANNPSDYERLTFGFNQYSGVGSDAFIGTEKNGSGSSRALMFLMSGSELMRLHTNGNVGIGTTNPQAALEVRGQTRSTGSGGATKINSSSSVDWNNGNAQSMSVACTNTTFANMLDGGTYILAVTETTATQCVFAQSGLTFLYSPANGSRSAGQQTVYSFQRIGTTVYVSWIAGFQ